MHNPTDNHKKIAALAMMFECFPQSKVTDAMNQTFLEAVTGVSLEAVQRATADFRHGRDNRTRKDFIPSTAQFSAHASDCERLIQQEAYRKLHSVRKLPKPQPRISAEERARMAEKMAYLKEHGPELTAQRYNIELAGAS